MDLDEAGVRQARATAARLERCGVAAIYSSPLRRALATAGIIGGRCGLEPRPEPGLIDIDYGRWQGMTHAEALADDPGTYHLWLTRPYQVTFPGGEGLARVRDRAVAAVQALSPRHDGQTVVLVCHKVVIKVLVCCFLALGEAGFWRFQQSFCALNVFETGRKPPVMYLFNDACHLQGEQASPSA